MRLSDSVTIYHGDCVEAVPISLSMQSASLILVDLPYGTTKCKWDVMIPFDKLWAMCRYLRKEHTATVFFGTQPFTSLLISSNIKEFKYCWTWDKTFGRGHLVAKYRPMQQTEDVAVFGKGRINYYPQRIPCDPYLSKEGTRTNIMGGKQSANYVGKIRTEKEPTTVLQCKPVHNSKSIHPTQKPVVLLEYLILTYTQEDDMVIDFTMGSASTCIACINTQRRFTGIEKDDDIFLQAKDRIEQRLHMLF